MTGKRTMMAGVTSLILALTGGSAFAQSGEPDESISSETQGNVIVRHGQTQAQLMQTSKDLKAAGYRPSFLRVYVHDGHVRYDSKWQPKNGIGWRFSANMSPTRYQQRDEEMATRGYKRVYHSSVKVNGQTRHTALWQRDD